MYSFFFLDNYPLKGQTWSLLLLSTVLSLFLLYSSPPAQASGEVGITLIGAGKYFTCAVTYDGTIACWGDDEYGQIKNRPSGSFTQLATGESHACAVRNDGTLACWGRNTEGQTNAPAGTFSQITAGSYHTCGLKTDHTVACWGNVGFESVTPPADTFSQISAGGLYTCGVKTNGQVSCWGRNNEGQATPLYGQFSQVSAGWAHTCGVTNKGTTICWGRNVEGQASSPEDNFLQVYAGGFHSCGLKTDSTLVCWGSNWGYYPINERFWQITVGGFHTCGVEAEDGKVKCKGDDSYGQSTPPQVIVVRPLCISVTPNTKDFGTLSVNQTSPKQLFTVTNQCDPHLLIESVDITGDYANQFEKNTDTCSGRQVTPVAGTAVADVLPTSNGSCVVEIGFQPTTIGTKNAVLLVSYNNGNTQVTLTGTGSNTPMIRTLILTNYQKLATLYNPDEANRVINKLNELASHSDVQGLVLSVENDPTVAATYATRNNYEDEDKAQANAVAEAIKQVILGQWTDQLENIVIVGDDRVVPFYRIDDGLQELYHHHGILPDKWTLTDDFYTDRPPFQDCLKCANPQIYIPEIPSGRLLETPSQIVGMIDTFLANNTLSFKSAAVAGWDFMVDGAQSQCKALTTAGIVTDCSLVSPSWTSHNFIERLLNIDHDVISINAHANYWSFQAPDRGTMSVSDFTSTSVDFTGSLFYTMGCHSGQNVSDKLDLPESLAMKRANYIANTGYGLGDQNGIKYSEELMGNFTKELLKPQTTLGKALMLAKQQYYADNLLNISDLDNVSHEKAGPESTLYGLPMYRISSPSAIAAPSNANLITQRTENSQEQGLQKNGWSFSWQTAMPAIASPAGDTFYSWDGTVAGGDGDPMLPKFSKDVSNSGQALHGLVFRGGEYTVVNQSPPFQQLVTTNGDLLSSRTFTASHWYPAKFFTPNTIQMNTGNKDMLIATAGQYHAQLGQQRVFKNMDFDTYYHTSDNDRTVPTVYLTDRHLQGNTASITVTTSDASGIKEVVIAYTDGTGTWNSQNLTDSGNGTAWAGEFAADSDTEFFIQAVDKAGNVAVNDNQGSYFPVAGEIKPPPEPETATESQKTVTESPIEATCDANKCSYPNIPFDKAGFYIAQVRLGEGSQEGYWGLEAKTSSGANTGGFNAGTVLKENGLESGFIGFYLGASEAVTLTVQEYSGNVSKMRVVVEQQDLQTGQRTTVYGPTVMASGGSDTTPRLAPGFYVASATSQDGNPRGRFGMELLGQSFTGGVNVGGWIDNFTGGNGEGFGAFYVASPQNVKLNLLFGENYGTKGAGPLTLTILYQNPTTGEREFYWSPTGP